MVEVGGRKLHDSDSSRVHLDESHTKQTPKCADTVDCLSCFTTSFKMLIAQSDASSPALVHLFPYRRWSNLHWR